MITPAPRTKILLIENDQQAADSIRAALAAAADGRFDVEWVRQLSRGLTGSARKELPLFCLR